MKCDVIIGIDPGLHITGYGIVEIRSDCERLIEGGVIRTSPSAQLPERLLEINRESARLFTQFIPRAVAVEELYVHYKHPRTAVIMGHARGAVLLAAGQCGVPVIEYSATRIKRSLTGNGRASKEQVRRMVVSRLGLTMEPEPPDVSDGLAAALCHASHCRGKSI